MKKMLMALSLLVAQHFSYGQTTVFFSDMDGFGNEINKCDRFTECLTYDIMCTGAPGTCSSASSVGRWLRIGTPHKISPATPSRIGMVAGGSDNSVSGEQGDCEGLFTDFNFVPGRTYNIHIGISKMDLHPGSNTAISPNEAALKLYSGNELNETIAKVCCQEKYLWMFSTGSSYNYNTFWSNNNYQGSMNPNPIELIGSITPGLYWSGITKDFVISYTVPLTGVTPTIFAFHTYLNAGRFADPTASNSPKNQVDFEIDYVKIEEPCLYNSNFTYTYNTFNPLDVQFWPSTYSAPAPYSWQFGDGGVSGSSVTTNHTYPSFGTYNPSLAIGDCLRQFAKLCLNQPDVNNYIPGNTSDPVVDPNNNNAKPCNPHFEFFGGSTNPYEVGITTLGGHTGPTAFNVVWGDGTSSTSGMPQSFIHTYSAPGTYNICVEADDKRCTVCLPICIEQLGTGDNGGGGPFGGTGGEGKQGVTSVSNKVVPITINSIVPNPAKSMVTLSIDGKIDAKASVKIFDITGKVVITTEKNISIGANKIDLDVQNLTAGVYIIEVRAGSESIARAKMTKE